MKYLFLILSSLFLALGNAQAFKVYLISNHDNAGEHNQALGIATALEKIYSSKIDAQDLNIKKESSESIQSKIEKDLLSAKVIVIGVGESGIEGIKKLSKNSKLTIGLTSHMFLTEYEDPALLDKVSFIALPIHVSSEIKNKLGAKLLPITGVAHNRQSEIVEKVYTEEQKVLPQCPSYLGVILGGDAPTPSNEIKLFTQDDAQRLATYVINHAKEACVLVLNGPRTGKHDSAKNEILTAHKDGKLDSITTIFKERLELALSPSKVKVFDFQFDQKPPYNTFDLVAGTIKATKGILLIPGESTSMISEAVDVLSPGQVIVYNNSAMNDVHKAHVVSEMTAGRISLLEDYFKLSSLSSAIDRSKSSAAEVIAQKLWKDAHASNS